MTSTVISWYLVLPMRAAHRPDRIWPAFIMTGGALDSQPAYLEAPPSSVKSTATMAGQMMAWL